MNGKKLVRASTIKKTLKSGSINRKIPPALTGRVGRSSLTILSI